ncbi:MAG: DUF3592 domain-containing protein [bacterium]|nr:DUF3592 domain-containing protein [bacterium]
MKWMVLVIFGGMGLAALIGGLTWGAKRISLYRNGLSATGIVVETYQSISTDSDDNNSVSYYPVVEFQTPDGQTHRFKGSTGSSSPDFEDGARVKLRYNPNDRSDAQLVNFSQFWLGPVVLTAAGLIALFLGVGSFVMLFGGDKDMASMRSLMERNFMTVRKDAVRIEGRIRQVRQKGKDQYVFVCKGLKPGASFEDEFESDIFNFDPGMEFSGRPVAICLDPYKKGEYTVDLGPLLMEIIKKQSR